jgi:hypothetical protein
VLSFRHIQGSLGQRYDIYPRAWESYAEHMRRRRKAVQEQNGRSISGTGFAIEDFQPLHVKRAIENGRCNRVRYLNSSSVREFQFRRR